MQSAEVNADAAPSLTEALVQLIGAEAGALHVAGLALQQPVPAELAPQPDEAGARVMRAVQTYVRAMQTVLGLRR